MTLPATGVPAGEQAIAGSYTTTYRYAIDGKLRETVIPAAGNLDEEKVEIDYNAASDPHWMAGGLGWGVYVAGSDWSAFGQPLLLDLGNTYFRHYTQS